MFFLSQIDSLTKGLVDTEKIEEGIDKKQKVLKGKMAAKKSPTKRAQRNGGGGGRRRSARNVSYVDSDSDSDSYLNTLIESNTTTAHHAVHRPQQHDPNTIVLDCDDEFFGGPAVNFTRNIAGANAVTAEQSQEMKVNVRINNKVEQYQMNQVSYLITMC